jgi:hypothetical protein
VIKWKWWWKLLKNAFLGYGDARYFGKTIGVDFSKLDILIEWRNFKYVNSIGNFILKLDKIRHSKILLLGIKVSEY